MLRFDGYEAGTAQKRNDSPGLAKRFTFHEFFCGGGMARAGLGDEWACLLANDIDPRKTAVYEANWGATNVECRDISSLEVDDLLLHRVDLAWASFPCQDLSDAGKKIGLSGGRSGLYWKFHDIVQAMNNAGQKPRIVVIENVIGTINSQNGTDFLNIVNSLQELLYKTSAMTIDAVHFVPQSRPRIFIVGVDNRADISDIALEDVPISQWVSKSLATAHAGWDEATKDRWFWPRLPSVVGSNRDLASILDDDDETGVEWHSPDQTLRLIAMMSETNLGKLENARNAMKPVYGTIYKRTRRDRDGGKVQRAEARFDGIAGCLRTPAGGSSRQTIVKIDGAATRTRLLSGRESARLMGLDESYILPEGLNEALHLTGDGVVVPVVRFLRDHLFEPFLCGMGR